MTVAGVSITSPDREVYPDIGLTKLQVAEYYEAVASLMVPHVRERPISSVRCPDGIDKKCFYQKHWPTQGGARINTKPVTEDDGVVHPYAFAASARDLVALVQHGTVETHIWGSRIDKLEKPDRLVLDLDPGPGVTWRTIRASAVEVRELLEELSLQSWVKLTGGKGIHVVVPIERRAEWDIASAFAKATAERLVRNNPKRYVAKASKAARTNKIFVDWMRNSRGATFVAPWSARARAGAPVSVPVTWEELASVRKANQFTIPNVLKRIATESDPWLDMLACKQRLTPDMARQLLDESA